MQKCATPLFRMLMIYTCTQSVKIFPCKYTRNSANRQRHLRRVVGGNSFDFRLNCFLCGCCFSQANRPVVVLTQNLVNTITDCSIDRVAKGCCCCPFTGDGGETGESRRAAGEGRGARPVPQSPDPVPRRDDRGGAGHPVQGHEGRRR